MLGPYLLVISSEFSSGTPVDTEWPVGLGCAEGLAWLRMMLERPNGLLASATAAIDITANPNRTRIFMDVLPRIQISYNESIAYERSTSRQNLVGIAAWIAKSTD